MNAILSATPIKKIILIIYCRIKAVPAKIVMEIIDIVHAYL